MLKNDEDGLQRPRSQATVLLDRVLLDQPSHIVDELLGGGSVPTQDKSMLRLFSSCHDVDETTQFKQMYHLMAAIKPEQVPGVLCVVKQNRTEPHSLTDFSPRHPFLFPSADDYVD